MFTVLSNLLLAIAMLTGVAALFKIIAGTRQLRKMRPAPLRSSVFILLAVASLFTACEKDPVAADGELPVLDGARISHDTLYLDGQFGPTPGAVLVNGVELPSDDLVEWTSDQIICIKRPPVPEQIVVEVVVEHRKSQPRIIQLANNFRITYMMVDEQQFKLYIFGSFGPDPGPANRSITIGNHVIGSDNFSKILMWSPSLILCQIRSTGLGSSGEVVVSKGASLSTSRMLNEWRGTLFYDRPQGGNNGNLHEYVWFEMVLRGDTAATIPPEAVPFQSILRTEPNEVSSAIYEAGGSAQCSYTMDGCAMVHVSWAATSGDVFLHPNGHDYAGETHFNGYVHPVAGGFDIELFFEAWEVTPSTITTYPCSGDPFVTNRNESIQFDAFEGETIELRFENNAIKAGQMTRTGLGSNGALSWDVIEVPIHLVTAHLTWDPIAPKH